MSATPTLGTIPHSVAQFAAYFAAMSCGLIVARLLQFAFGHWIAEPTKLIRMVTESNNKLRREFGHRSEPLQIPARHLGTLLQGWVGGLEIILYSSAVVFGYPDFIAIWFATKYVASYSIWGRDPIGRTFYNRSLFGSGLNILVGFFTGQIAQWAIHRVAR
jgi:hypothetical protein